MVVFAFVFCYDVSGVGYLTSFYLIQGILVVAVGLSRVVTRGCCFSFIRSFVLFGNLDAV